MAVFHEKQTPFILLIKNRMRMGHASVSRGDGFVSFVEVSAISGMQSFFCRAFKVTPRQRHTTPPAIKIALAAIAPDIFPATREAPMM